MSTFLQNLCSMWFSILKRSRVALYTNTVFIFNCTVRDMWVGSGMVVSSRCRLLSSSRNVMYKSICWLWLYGFFRFQLLLHNNCVHSIDDFQAFVWSVPFIVAFKSQPAPKKPTTIQWMFFASAIQSTLFCHYDRFDYFTDQPLLLFSFL